MALQSIKSVIENKGYLIDQKDRAIFELGDLQSFFGFSENDAIEFIVYDSNDNQLPQINGELVRYITLSTQNINDYFLIPNGTIFQKYQLPKEYFIDVERLLREAGYNNGIFKTQITLINKRVGSNNILDKMWISEISPSRTEVRLFPLIKNQPAELLDNLKERYNTFVNNKKFREDYIIQAFEYIEKINPSLVGSFLKTKYGESFFQSMVNEYKIQSFDIFVTNVHKLFMEACIYEFTNRISDINDINYGKAKKIKPKVTIYSNELQASIQKILVSVLNKFLPNPDIKNTSTFDLSTNESLDEVSTILQKTTSDVIVETGKPVVKTIAVVEKKEPVLNTDIKYKLKKQLPIDEPPPIIKFPKDMIPPVDDSGPIIDIIKVDDIPIKQFPMEDIVISDVIIKPFPETDIRIPIQKDLDENSDKRNDKIFGGGGSKFRSIVKNKSNGEINVDDYFSKEIENLNYE